MSTRRSDATQPSAVDLAAEEASCHEAEVRGYSVQELRELRDACEPLLNRLGSFSDIYRAFLAERYHVLASHLLRQAGGQA